MIYKLCIGVIVPPQPSQIYVWAFVFLKMPKVKVNISLPSHEDAGGGDAILVFHPSFDIRHNYDGRDVSCTYRLHFTPKEISWY